jgi:hypothetical protein
MGKSYGWLIRLTSQSKPDVVIVGRLAPGNEQFLDYYFFKPRNGRGKTQETIRPDKVTSFEKYRYDDLSFLPKLIRMSKRKRIQR